MSKFHDHLNSVSALLLTLVLSACGGGGGGGDDSPTTSSNHAPVIGSSPTSVSLAENSTQTINLPITDADNDAITVTIDSSNPDVISANWSNNQLQLTSGDVSDSQTETLTIQAKDSHSAAATPVTISVAITNITSPSSYEAFTLEWAGSSDLLTFQGAQTQFTFALTKGSVAVEEFTHKVVLTDSVQGHNVNLDGITVDMENAQLTIDSPPADSRPVNPLNGTLTLNDGTTEQTLDFKLTFTNSDATPGKSLMIVLEEGQSQTESFVSLSGLSPESVHLDEQTPLTIFWGSPYVAINLNDDNQTFTVTANPGSAHHSAMFYISVEDKHQLRSTVSVEVFIKGSQSALEQDLEEQLIRTERYIRQSNEYERLGEYLVDLLELKGRFSTEEAHQQRVNLLDIRYTINLEAPNQIDCIRSALSIGHPRFLRHFQTEDNLQKSGYLCSANEVNVYSDITRRTTENHYANRQNYDEAIKRLQVLKDRASDFYTLTILLDRINLLRQLTLETTSDLALPKLEKELMAQVSDDLYSRFVGKPQYGQWVDGTWVFSAEYQLLNIAHAMATDPSQTRLK